MGDWLEPFAAGWLALGWFGRMAIKETGEQMLKRLLPRVIRAKLQVSRGLTLDEKVDRIATRVTRVDERLAHLATALADDTRLSESDRAAVRAILQPDPFTQAQKGIGMFPLKQRAISGYRFGKATWYSKFHLGVDYAAKFDPLYAPFDGTITEVLYGKEGGKTIWFKPDHENVIIRFLHLDQFHVHRGQRVAQGDLIAVTGNTGKITTGPHLHVDISKGSVKLTDTRNFIDPEAFNWGVEAVTEQPNEPVTEQPVVLHDVTPPSAPPSEFPRTFTAVSPVYVRDYADHRAPLSGSRKLFVGDVFTGVDRTVGSDPYGDGRNTWIKSTKGNFVWEGALK